MSLKELEKRLQKELRFLDYPPAPWVVPTEGYLDVAIVGGGMAGLAAAFALRREGISNFQIFDAHAAGRQGPWATYARMQFLRSPKMLAGPAEDLPALTFQSWYTSQYGEEGWAKLYKIPTQLWMDYLNWYRAVLKIPVQTHTRVTLLEEAEQGIRLHREQGEPLTARKVIVATGREGFGGMRLPTFARHLKRELYAHTCEPIAFEKLKGKKVAILGAGASAFDAAAVVLEEGAASVTILERRREVPYINKFASTTYRGVSQGFFELPDRDKIAFIGHGFETGAPPPFESLDRVKDYAQFQVWTGTEIERVEETREGLKIETSRGPFDAHFFILATGFEIDGRLQPEFSSIIEAIRLWKDQILDLSPNLGKFPYLGPHFQFLEKHPGQAPFLKNLYCFNFAATLSHALLSSDIPAIGLGAARLARGIAADFFTQSYPAYLQRLKDYTVPEFLSSDYPFFRS